ncbi:MAG: Zn-ribbon domain-containing OB-fold protein [Dehalococcoidia bacterium]
MPKQSPVPEDVDREFFEAANQDRLVIQNCTACNRLQHPPQPACSSCGSGDNLEWKEMSGKGTIYSYAVVYDTPVASLQADQPYNCAIIALDEDPGIKMLSHLPGTPVDEVPMDAPVRAVFQPTPATGQKVVEWEVVN